MSLYPAGTPHETQLASAQTLDGPFATEMKKLAKTTMYGSHSE